MVINNEHHHFYDLFFDIDCFNTHREDVLTFHPAGQPYCLRCSIYGFRPITRRSGRAAELPRWIFPSFIRCCSSLHPQAMSLHIGILDSLPSPDALQTIGCCLVTMETNLRSIPYRHASNRPNPEITTGPICQWAKRRAGS